MIKSRNNGIKIITSFSGLDNLLEWGILAGSAPTGHILSLSTLLCMFRIDAIDALAGLKVHDLADGSFWRQLPWLCVMVCRREEEGEKEPQWSAVDLRI